MSCSVKGLDNLHIIFRCLAAAAANQCNRRYGNSLIDNRNTIIQLNLLTDLHKIRCLLSDLTIYLLTNNIYIIITAVKKTDTHCNCTDVQVGLLNHLVRFLNFKYIDHLSYPPLLNSMHDVKNLFVLHFDLNTKIFTDLIKILHQ